MNPRDLCVMQLRSSLCGIAIADGPPLGCNYPLAVLGHDAAATSAHAGRKYGMVRPCMHPALQDEPALVATMYLAAAREAGASKRARPDDSAASPDCHSSAQPLPRACTYVSLHGTEHDVFLARPEYSLAGILPEGSLVHAFVYFEDEHSDRPIVSLFDCSVVTGDPKNNLPPPSRFGLLHESMRTTMHAFRTDRQHVRHHWLGELACAAQQVRDGTAPFQIHSLLAAPDTLPEGPGWHACGGTGSMLQEV